MPTIGIDFKIKLIQVKDQRVKLQLWDTAGQERFQTITTSYYKGAMGVILVYDCTQRATFNSVVNWLKQVNEHAEDGVLRILVCNKIDLANQAVSQEEGQALATKYGLEFYMTSARSGEGVETLFSGVCDKVISQSDLNAERRDEATVLTGIDAHPKSKSAKNSGGGCCS